ncbi:restriction endonuclease subunit S [Lactiplantibacillus pentosus]|uniref:restriction endonuclease subunit S n=1 Tax=Lactiplantibacillus pentosus TaxID=1589 RepID=UPI001C1EBB7F|nr:restriction endonuclease subunit S [Lactiplantibacillus pentosus]MBU7478744.1 restriction endonuclease subunit S [Lactiplantibacillus pentosus]MBU7536547.1 restriction endonuclease subunit S [Lactiplantibacillus pentosus]MDT7037134.1 restriction endonuclease subunit S [Lactiplantibacillus pentosus]
MKDNQAKYPQLRFKGFTDPWEERKLGDLGSVAMNKRIFKEQTSDVGDIPFYKIGTLGGTPDAFISRDIFEEYKSKYQYPEVGDILISASGSIGRTVVYQGYDEYFQDSNIVWLKHDQQLDNSFLKQFYSIVKWQGLEGSTIKRLYNKNILETKITLPSPEEQAQLGSFFKQLDDTIALHQRKLAKLKELKQGYLQKLFPRNGSKFPQLRFAGFADAWEQRKLGEEAQLTMGQSPNSENYTKNPDDYILVQGNADMKNGRVVPRVWTTQITKKAEKSDLILSVRAPVGDIGKTDYDVVLGRGVAAIKGNEFIFQQLGKMKLTGYWTRYSTGSTFESINSNDIKDAKIMVPVEEEQQKIGSFFQQLDHLITLHQRKLEKLQELKKGYLQKMFC